MALKYLKDTEVNINIIEILFLISPTLFIYNIPNLLNFFLLGTLTTPKI